MCAQRRKTNAARAKGSSLATSPIQRYRKIYAHNTVCLQSGRARGILYVKSNLSNSSVQSVLIVNVHTLRKKPVVICTQEGYKSLLEMRNMFLKKFERGVEHVFFYHQLYFLSL